MEVFFLSFLSEPLKESLSNSRLVMYLNLIMGLVLKSCCFSKLTTDCMAIEAWPTFSSCKEK